LNCTFKFAFRKRRYFKTRKQQWNSLNLYLREFFRRETRAVLAKRRAKALSHVARDSNVTLRWSGVERGWGRGRVAQVVSRTSFLDFHGAKFHCVGWTQWFKVARIIEHERRRWKYRLVSLIQTMILRGCTWSLPKCWRHKVDWLIWVALWSTERPIVSQRKSVRFEKFS